MITPPELHVAASRILTEYARSVDTQDESGLVAILATGISIQRGDGYAHGTEAFLDVFRAA